MSLPVTSALAASRLPFGLEGPEMASILVAGIAAFAAWSSQRSAARASVRTVADSSRADIEKEAFTRAQGFLDGTILRQNEEIAELRTDLDSARREVRELRAENNDLRGDIRKLQAHVAHLEETAL
jgi:septal ring factor EnvC (AmiA/AmiB activator)